ncbi:MAG: hypothetical protein PWP74_1466 [Shewanella sp.]|jgi:hypothetical protein|nr:hypothetical protein [Shewanella sp.]
MPLLVFDMIEGRTPTAVRKILDCSHQVVLDVFGVPARDRYQIVHENKDYQMVIEDTGLGYERSRDVIVLRVFTSPRSLEQKHLFMQRLSTALQHQCAIAPQDLVISFFSNSRDDWSFGEGEAQYSSGRLGATPK